MIPNGGLSDKAHIAGFQFPVKSTSPEDRLQDWELAGKYLNDPSDGLMVKVWRVALERTDDPVSEVLNVTLHAPGGVSLSESSRVLFSGEGITEVALAFDQNMNPFIAYMQDGMPKIYWYDGNIPGMTHTNLPAGCYDLRCTLDEKRAFNVSNSDIVLSYLRGGNLCARYQRDRYENEYILKSSVGANAELISMAMNVGSRLQWRMRGFSIADDSNVEVSDNPFLSDVVESICNRAGLSRTLHRTDELYSKQIIGFTIGSSYSAAGSLQSLSSVFFFDPSSVNGLVKFKFRGADSVSSLYSSSFIAEGDESDVVDATRYDAIEVPRVLHLNYYDVNGGLNTDKQRSERPEGTRGDFEQSMQTPVILSANDAASIVHKTHGLMVEQQKGALEFTLPDSYIFLAESDPVLVQYGSKMVRAIVSRAEIDEGEIKIKAVRDRQSLYTADIEGIPAAEVPMPPSSVAGPTLVELIDSPIIRSSHDTLGFYIAASGVMPAWPGAVIDLSIDGGQTWIESQSTRVGSLIGELVSPLGGHPHQYPDEHNECTVFIKSSGEFLEGTYLAGMMNRLNYAVIGDELINFSEVDEITPNTWKINGLLRGRLGTEATPHSAGERFVTMDSVVFVPADLTWIGRDITLRAATFGRPIDEATIVTFQFTGNSQRERAPSYLSARRESGNAIVSWQGVGRLGAGVNVAMGAYFSGYVVTITDGTTTQSFDVANPDIVTPITSFTGAVTISVQQRNQITGLGPKSEVII